MLTLYGSKGCGSAAIEVALELLGEPFKYVAASTWDGGAPFEELKRHNPLGQVPTLVADDGTVITESAAILLWLLDRHPDTPLAPARGDARRAALFRWTTFLATQVYAALGVGDFPDRWVDGESAQQSLVARANARVEGAWRILEEALAPSPYLLGKQFTLLDAYAGMMSHWRPRREWLAQHCPKVAKALALGDSHPVVGKVWARNF
jgi:GST-like protein